MKGLIATFLLGLALVLGSYVLMVRAIDRPQPSNSMLDANLEPAFTGVQPVGTASRSPSNSLSRAAMEQVIDCYAGKPVYLDPEKSRPLYPSCEQLLRIYQGQTSDPEMVLMLLSQAQQENKDE